MEEPDSKEESEFASRWLVKKTGGQDRLLIRLMRNNLQRPYKGRLTVD